MAGSPEAGAFLFDVWQCVSAWDDLIDGDEMVDQARTNDTFWRALITIPANPFYAKYADAIRTVGVVAIANWLAANKLEEQGNRELGWFMRMSFVDLIVLCAFINGGLQQAVSTAIEARTFLQAEEELADYVLKGQGKE
jgi:hypothetical protein